jgi:prevent-host-death family protein
MAKPNSSDEETVPATQAPDRLGSMLDEVLRGKSFKISRYGRDVARLVPIEESEKKGRK